MNISIELKNASDVIIHSVITVQYTQSLHISIVNSPNNRNMCL